MKKVFPIILLLQFLSLALSAQQNELKDKKQLVSFLSDIVTKSDTSGTGTRIFSIKVFLGKHHKVDSVLASTNSPSELQAGIHRLKDFPVSWEQIVNLPTGEKAILVIPIIDIKQTPSGLSVSDPYNDLMGSAFDFKDGKGLFKNKPVQGLWLMEAVYVIRQKGFPPQM